MIAKRLLASSVKCRTHVRRFATQQQQEVQGPAETQKRVAESIFERAMWPLVAITVVVGFAGYQYRRNLINTGPLPADHKTVDDIRKEAHNEQDFEKKLIKAVDRERDTTAERVWSKGALAKGSLVSSPEVPAEEKHRPQFETEREAALTKLGVNPKA
jgi:hypothetical protein